MSLDGPDLSKGIGIADIPEGGTLLGHADGEAVLLVRPPGGEEVFAIRPTCTHYGGPLAEGMIVGGQIVVDGGNVTGARPGRAIRAPLAAEPRTSR